MNHYEAILTLLKEKKKDEALELALQWTAQEPKQMKAWSCLHHVYVSQKMFELAHSAINTAIDLNPKEPGLYYFLGNVQMNRQQFSDASYTFNNCINACLDLDDDYYLNGARLSYAKCLASIGRLDEAKKIVLHLPANTIMWFQGDTVTPEKLLAYA